MLQRPLQAEVTLSRRAVQRGGVFVIHTGDGFKTPPPPRESRLGRTSVSARAGAVPRAWNR